MRAIVAHAHTRMRRAVIYRQLARCWRITRVRHAAPQQRRIMRSRSASSARHLDALIGSAARAAYRVARASCSAINNMYEGVNNDMAKKHRQQYSRK